MWEIDSSGRRTPWVAKSNKTTDSDRSVCFDDAKVASVASVYGEAFNRAALKAGPLPSRYLQPLQSQ